ncbi:unnamed protein product [Brachionus calyciflorus]|uniref:Cation-transporting P-type ATPase N-terminal domain-containing protein n=1 Tax=Brachionus calyciflorus TaxID=104777 RepID=A0A813ZJP6_9BILA|nr:unnamed protein product [Brachionus calyciflorus]
MCGDKKNKKKYEIREVEYDHHKISFDEISKNFNTSLEHGLEQTYASELLVKNGKNQIRTAHKNIFLKTLSYFFTGFCSLLWISSIICILAWKPIGNPPDATNLGLGILLIVVIILQAAFSAFQDWSSGKVMKSIKNMMPSSATVIRNGTEKKIPVEEVVVGDLVLLSYGNKVPADVRIIETHDLKFDKSMLTGESEAIEGTLECTDDRYVESKNIAFMTTLITNGQGKGIVVATGGQTMMGKIACLTNTAEEKETSLQKELKRFIIIVATAAVIAAVSVVLSWNFWLNVKYPHYINIPSLLVNTISVMIAFIPEGLPVCVTLSLLMIAKRMAKSRVLVKNLGTIETLSCVNLIASDKTGTLTQNKMFVGNALAGLENLNLNFIREGYATKQIIGAAYLCNNAHFDENDKNTSIELRSAVGDATDIALLKFSHKYNDIKKFDDCYSELWEIPFNSRNKWMMKCVKSNDQEFHDTIFNKNSSSLMLIKGAPDILLKKCRTILQNDGNELELTDDILDQLCKIQNDWCLMGQRVIVLCKRNCESDLSEWIVKTPVEQEAYINENCNDFCMIGMLGIIDPPREGIADVIAKCREAGIRVSMVTGDYALTAAAIANQVGIFSKPIYDTILNVKDKVQINKKNVEPTEIIPTTDKFTSLLLNGTDLGNLTDEDWRMVTKYDEIVFARTTPEQKLRIVKEFQKDRFVVGVTGDGVNDAPALKSADIGIAMGGGSEVAMEASQLVLLDNNFASILIAIRNGRLVFYNLKKVILYLLPGGCVAELVPVLLSIFFGVPQTLSSFQMLVISLFTDIAPSLSLMMEREETDLLKQPPRSRKSHLVDWKFILHAYFFLGLLISFFSQCMFFMFMYIHQDLLPTDLFFDFGNNEKKLKLTDKAEFENILNIGQSITFASLVLMQLFGNLLTTRTHKRSFFQSFPLAKGFRNPWIFVAQLFSICLLLLTLYTRFFNEFFNTRPIPLEFFMLPIGCSIFIFSADEIRKFFARSKFLCFHKVAW